MKPELIRDETGVSLRIEGFKPLQIDFIKSWKQVSIGKQDVFARAIGVRNGWKRVVDATAGLGGDSLKLLKLGCEVTMIERSPVLFQLLEDAVRRAEQNPLWVQKVKPRLKLVRGNAEEFFADISEKSVIYLDPMFPERDSSALPKGEMQILSKLLGEPELITPLWQAARKVTGARVVLKRPLDAPQELEKPNQTYCGKTVRYDVW